jgi:hypothetical protein
VPKTKAADLMDCHVQCVGGSQEQFNSRLVAPTQWNLLAEPNIKNEWEGTGTPIRLLGLPPQTTKAKKRGTGL